jgi:hypothetical protein
MKYEPHEYQKYAIGYIESHPIAAVLLSMGLGKTSISLTAINDLLFDSFEISKVLIVAPLRVASVTWSAEIEKWEHLKLLKYSVAVGTETERLTALNTQADIYIINRENVQWLIEKSGVPFNFDMVSRHSSQAFFRCKCLRISSCHPSNLQGRFLGKSSFSLRISCARSPAGVSSFKWFRIIKV